MKTSCWNRSRSRQHHSTLAVIAAGFGLLLAACSSSLEMQVQSEVPRPAISQLPIHVGVYYPESLSQHVFEQNSEDRGLWRIETGQAQMTMFRRILPAMCSGIQEVSAIPVPGDIAIDAVVSPTLESMQLALPEETPFDFYEAWVRYKMRLLNPDGSLIAEWSVIGYGKVSGQGMFPSREENLNAALNAALRDAGGQFALGFSEQRAVRDWLCEKAAPESNICQSAVAA